MAIAKRGGRRIEVDGVPLRWWYRLAYCGSATCPQDPPHVLIAHESRDGTVIVCHLDTDGAAITPSIVADVARRAIARGWQPGVGSGILHVAHVA